MEPLWVGGCHLGGHDGARFHPAVNVVGPRHSKWSFVGGDGNRPSGWPVGLRFLAAALRGCVRFSSSFRPLNFCSRRCTLLSAFVMMFAVGVRLSELTARVRRQELAA